VSRGPRIAWCPPSRPPAARGIHRTPAPAASTAPRPAARGNRAKNG